MFEKQNDPHQMVEQQKQKQDATIEELLNVDPIKTQVRTKFKITKFPITTFVHYYYIKHDYTHFIVNGIKTRRTLRIKNSFFLPICCFNSLG